MASTALIGDGMVRQNPALGEGVWMSETLETSLNGNGPFYPAAAQGDGTAAFYSFESYTPQSTEYDGRTEPVILIRVYQFSETASLVRDGYLYMWPASLDLYTSYVGNKELVINEKVQYGILGVKNILGDTKTRVLISYCDKRVTVPKLMGLYSGYNTTGADLDTGRDIYTCDAYWLYKGLIRSVAKTGYTEDTMYWIAKGCGGRGGGNSDNNPRLHQPFEPLSDLHYDTSSMIADLDAFMTSFAVSGDWAEKFLVGLRKLVEWELYVPVNAKNSVDKKGGSMFEYNRDDALKVYLLNRCMGVTTEACRTHGTKCTQFLSDGSVGKKCNEVAKLSDYAKQAAYKTACGIQPDGDNMGQPFKNLSLFRDALATVDCSCINYKNSTYAQPNLVGRDYARFVNDFPKLDLPDEAYCWWPTCTEKSQTLTVTSQSGPTDSSLYDPKCPAIINNMKRITAGQDPLLPGDKGFTPSSSGAGFSTPASDTQGPESGSDTTNVHTPAGVMDQVKLLPKLSWFIPVVVVLGILILAAIGWFVYQNYFSKTTTAATPLKPKTPALRPIGKA
jgi:hypothetical protein